MKKKAQAKGWQAISAQEWKVIRLIVDGHNQESIHHQIEVSRPTVKRHVSNICAKLELHSTLEIACKFYQDLLLLRVAREENAEGEPR